MEREGWLYHQLFYRRWTLGTRRRTEYVYLWYLARVGLCRPSIYLLCFCILFLIYMRFLKPVSVHNGAVECMPRKRLVDVLVSVCPVHVFNATRLQPSTCILRSSAAPTMEPPSRKSHKRKQSPPPRLHRHLPHKVVLVDASSDKRRLHPISRHVAASSRLDPALSAPSDVEAELELEGHVDLVHEDRFFSRYNVNEDIICEPVSKRYQVRGLSFVLHTGY